MPNLTFNAPYLRPLRRGRSSPKTAGAGDRPDDGQGIAGQNRRIHPEELAAIPSISQPPQVAGDDRVDLADAGSSSATNERRSELLSQAWQAFARTSTSVIKKLLAIYHKTVYPM